MLFVALVLIESICQSSSYSANSSPLPTWAFPWNPQARHALVGKPHGAQAGRRAPSSSSCAL
eukprot:6484062-Pyramimonas_sp.AAC.1